MGTSRGVTGAVALLPLCLAVAACGTQGPGNPAAVVADVRGVEVPTEALAPVMPEPVVAEALVASPARAARAVPVRAAVAVPAPTRTELDDVPNVALSAYHRAATVMREAAPECGLEWTLLAAIGRVETKHGHGRLDEDGLASPALVGAPLDGRQKRPLVQDTDAGQLDGDARFDRPVGPFRMLPSTWSVVGVDADTDGQRNPQDVDDAALGTGVQLCGPGPDLSVREEIRKALRRLRSEPGYPATVLGWYDAYVAAEAAMAVSATTVITYGDWSGAVQQVTGLARAAPAPEPRRRPRSPETPPKQPAKQPAKPGATQPSPPAAPAAPAAPAEEPAVKPAPEPAPEPAPAEPAPAAKPPPADAPAGTGGGVPACDPKDPAEPVEPEPAVTPTDGTTEPEECTTG